MKSKIHTPLAEQNIITRGLPKSGQIISYQDYDDGYYQRGWWKDRAYAVNKTRFVAQTIGGHDVVTDRATGLMWAADGNELGCNNGLQCNWVDAVNYARALTFAGFINWRLPNVNELASIIDHSQSSPAIDAVLFPNTSWDPYWTATSGGVLGFSGWAIDFIDGRIYLIDNKADLNHLRCVRGR